MSATKSFIELISYLEHVKFLVVWLYILSENRILTISNFFIVASMEKYEEYGWILLHVENSGQIRAAGQFLVIWIIIIFSV